MSEGELRKKYIANYQNRHMELLINGYLGIRRPTEEEATREFDAFVKPILDDVIKSFPTMNNCYADWLKLSKHGWKGVPHLETYVHNRRNDWFLFWLGVMVR